MPAEAINYTELKFSISATVQSQRYHAFCVSGLESNSSLFCLSRISNLVIFPKHIMKVV